MSDKMLVQHCAPTLADIKTGSLFSCVFGCKNQVVCSIRRLNQRLVSKGLRVIPLRYFNNRVLIYVYRPARLAADLSNLEAQALLLQVGYPNQPTDRCVPELIRRLETSEGFPHEIGLFLSYPPEDVRGFIENRACGYKCVGCWKVYGDADKAAKTFERYKRCTKSYFSQWLKGVAVEQLTVVGSYKE